MTPPRIKIAPPRLAVERQEAAASLGMGPEYFDDHVRDELPAIHVGSKTLYAVDDLREWLRRNRTIGGRAT